MKNILNRTKDSNSLDKLIEGIVDNMNYSDKSVVFPDISQCNKDEVPAEWFYDAYSGLDNTSERSAIFQYVNVQSRFPELATLFLGIAITEMEHLDKLGDIIICLGGTTTHLWSNKDIKVGDTAVEVLINAINGEEATIVKYKSLVQQLSTLNNKTSEICIQFVNKLIADEKVHIKLFIEALKKF